MSKENELLEAAETLLGIIDSDPAGVKDEEVKVKQAREIIAKHRPKPERLEGWVGVYPSGAKSFEETEAKCREACQRASRFVHVREVVPVEWERWDGDELYGEYMAERPEHDRKLFAKLAERHNAELERIANA
jgi:hypothetical protein